MEGRTVRQREDYPFKLVTTRERRPAFRYLDQRNIDFRFAHCSNPHRLDREPTKLQYSVEIALHL